MKPVIREVLNLTEEEIIAISVMLRDWRDINNNMRISECSNTDIDRLSAQIKFAKATVNNLAG